MPQAPKLVDELSPRLKAAQGLWARGRRADGWALFEQALREEPHNVQVYVAAARASVDAFEFDRMDEVLRRLAEAGPRNPGVHHYIGEGLLAAGLPDRALASFRTAANLPGAGPPTWLELASLCERAHQLDEADELVARTAAAGYDVPPLAIVRARIARRRGRIDEAVTLLTGMAERPGAAPASTSQAWGELALLRDAQGDYAGAAEAIKRCKATQRPFADPFIRGAQRTAGLLNKFNSEVTREDLRRWRTQVEELPRASVALLTGFPRSGTTLLEQVLDAHPDLVSSEERDFVGGRLLRDALTNLQEQSILATLERLKADDIVRERQAYLASMEYRLGQPIAGRTHLDKNPPYNQLIALVLRYFPEMRLVVALRDPRDVVLSCYLRHLPLNGVSVSFLDVRATAERYAADMRVWLRLREIVDVPWVEVRYEDSVADLAGQARRAFESLGLPWDASVLEYRNRLGVGKRVTSPSYEAVAKPVYASAIGRWRNYGRLMEPALETLAPLVREFGYEE